MEDTRGFVHLRLRGGRFDQAEGMPVAALAELLAFRDLVAATPRVLFRQDHPRRVRVPRRFDERLDLRLVRVEAGSAVPVLERRGDTGELPLSDEFDRARDLIIEVIEGVVRDGLFRDLPDDQLGTLFARLGQTLEGDESIEIGKPGAPQTTWPGSAPSLRGRAR